LRSESCRCARATESPSDLSYTTSALSMATGRTLRSLVSRRRRVEDEGEDEEGPVVVEDSQSEGSVLSEAEEEEDADASSLGGPLEAEAGAAAPSQEAGSVATNVTPVKKARKSGKKAQKKEDVTTAGASSQPQPGFKAMADTDAMMNGMKIADPERAQEHVVDFESMGANGSGPAPRPNGHPMSSVERQRREHEEYRKKRDSNPAFIPNRGNFFMHDTRGQANGPLPPDRNAWQARGRGRGAPNVGGPFSPANQVAQAERAAEQPWKHDLHDTINEEPPPQPTIPHNGPVSAGAIAFQTDSARLFPKVAPPPNNGQPRTISFDSTTLLGTVQVRVCLPGMKAPVSFSGVPVKRYIRLPNHRPPLRRDKPVRVFIPGHAPRPIFPAVDRSFIFIPRQMRQGYHRGFQRSIGGYGYSSRRTSMHGSIYSGSVAPSRRSSLAGVSRDRAYSPAGSFVGMPPSRPVVRLPYGSQPMSAASTPMGPLSGHHTPTGIPQMHSYPPPQVPQKFASSDTELQIPQFSKKKADMVALESPAFHQQPLVEPPPPPSAPAIPLTHPNQPPIEPQLFQNQLPAHMTEQQPPYAGAMPPYFSPGQQYQYPPPPPQAGTPLSGIPEQAVHAQSFQPPPYGQPPFYPPYGPQQGYYYSPPGPNGYGPMPPMYMMPPPQGYMLPPPGQPMSAPPRPPSGKPPSASGEQQQPPTSQSGMLAHESNGTVFYLPASEASSSEQYQPAESFVPTYAMPGLPPPTPVPDSQMQYYYPQMPHDGVQQVENPVYYPPQQ
jgi:hypothetical protein